MLNIQKAEQESYEMSNCRIKSLNEFGKWRFSPVSSSCPLVPFESVQRLIFLSVSLPKKLKARQVFVYINDSKSALCRVAAVKTKWRELAIM